MESNELKFLLKLLGCRDYKSPLGASIFNSFKNKAKICQALSDRELVDFSREIAAVKILPAGRALLKIDKDKLPITDKELKVLEKIDKGSGKIKPSEITSVKASERDAIFQSLSDRGLIATETSIKKAKAEVWLTDRGKEYLRDDYTCKGSNPTISLDLLNNYLGFLRKSLRVQQTEVATMTATKASAAPAQFSQPSDEEILQTIRDLDRELGTENFLPIFHLRQKLQPPLSREELDRALYRLLRNDKIEMNSLVDTTPYTPEQIDAGIPKDIGGPRFFIVVN